MQKYSNKDNFYNNQVQFSSVQSVLDVAARRQSTIPLPPLSTQRWGDPLLNIPFTQAGTKLYVREEDGMNPLQAMAVGYRQVNIAVCTSGNLEEGPVG